MCLVDPHEPWPRHPCLVVDHSKPWRLARDDGTGALSIGSCDHLRLGQRLTGLSGAFCLLNARLARHGFSRRCPLRLHSTTKAQWSLARGKVPQERKGRAKPVLQAHTSTSDCCGIPF